MTKQITSNVAKVYLYIFCSRVFNNVFSFRYANARDSKRFVIAWTTRVHARALVCLPLLPRLAVARASKSLYFVMMINMGMEHMIQWRQCRAPLIDLRTAVLEAASAKLVS